MSDGARRGQRFTSSFDLVWAMQSRGLSGRGKLVDVSIGGACVQLNQELQVAPGAIVSLVCSKLSALPSSGRVMWARKVGAATQLGLEFDQSNTRWTAWIDGQAQAVAARA